MKICPYCNGERDDMEGWHDCPGARDAKARIDKSIESMTRIATKVTPPEREPMTDMEIGRLIKGITFKDTPNERDND